MATHASASDLTDVWVCTVWVWLLFAGFLEVCDGEAFSVVDVDAVGLNPLNPASSCQEVRAVCVCVCVSVCLCVWYGSLPSLCVVVELGLFHDNASLLLIQYTHTLSLSLDLSLSRPLSLSLLVLQLKQLGYGSGLYFVSASADFGAATVCDMGGSGAAADLGGDGSALTRATTDCT